MKKVLASAAIGVTAFAAGTQWDKARRNRKSSDPVSTEKATAAESPASESKTSHTSVQARRNSETIVDLSMILGFLFSCMAGCSWAWLGLLCLDPTVSFVLGDLGSFPPVAEWLLPKELEPGPGYPAISTVLMLGGAGAFFAALAWASIKNAYHLNDYLEASA